MKLALPNDTRRRGFTLIELMVVLALIGIMSAMVIPELRGTYEDALLRSSSRKLIGVFNLACSRAITVNKQHRVRLDRNKSKYFIEIATPNGEFVPVRGVSGTEGRLDDRVTITIKESIQDGPPPMEQPDGFVTQIDPPSVMPDMDAILFYPDGTADNREIHLQDREGFRLALKINPITARVRIVEMERQN